MFLYDVHGNFLHEGTSLHDVQTYAISLWCKPKKLYWFKVQEFWYARPRRMPVVFVAVDHTYAISCCPFLQASEEVKR